MMQIWRNYQICISISKTLLFVFHGENFSYI